VFKYISSRVLLVSFASLLKLLGCSRFTRWNMYPIVLAGIETSLKLFSILIHCCVQLQHKCLVCSLHLVCMMQPACSMYITCHIRAGCSAVFRLPCECYLFLKVEFLILNLLGIHFSTNFLCPYFLQWMTGILQ
jgi:hypothetical protein